jgi:hypothetical protein
LIYFFWFVEYFFKILYNHYTLHLYFSFKESLRFFNFETLDLRNFFYLFTLENNLKITNIKLESLYLDVKSKILEQVSSAFFQSNYQGIVSLYGKTFNTNKDVLFFINLFKKSNTSKTEG